MPTFETPEPISVTVEIGVGDVEVVASDRTDTVVEVRPSDPDKKADVAAAAQTRVGFANGALRVRAPKGWKQWTPWGGHESIHVQIDVPAGSRLSGEAGVAALRCSGPLAGCRFRTGVGEINVEEVGPAELKTQAGDITVDRVQGTADITTGSGAVRIASVDGTAVVRNRNGDTWIGDVTGDARVNAANGTISIDLAHASVAAKTANGNVRLGEVMRQAVVAQTGFGGVEVGVRDGVAAWLDLDTKFGSVQNELDAAGRPEPGEDAVEIEARTSMGDITIRRSVASRTHTRRDEA